MVRAYKRKRPRQWRDKDKRMDAAARLRAQGLSLRQIGEALAVSHQTVANDLARWDERQIASSNVVSLSARVSNSTVKTGPQRGEIRQPDLTPDSTVTELRRVR